MTKIKSFILSLALISTPVLFAGTSKEKESEWWVRFFHQQVISLSIDEKGAHFVTRKDSRKFVLGDPDDLEVLRNYNFSSQFTLTKPGEVFFCPVHHGIDRFDVIALDNKSVILHFHSLYTQDSQKTDKQGEFTLTPFSNP